MDMKVLINSPMDVSTFHQLVKADPQTVFITNTDLNVVSYEYREGQSSHSNPVSVFIKAGTKLVRHPEYENRGYGPAMQKLEHSYNDRNRWFELNFNQLEYCH